MKGAKQESGAKPKRRLSVVLLFVMIIIGLIVMLVDFITDWMWFDEMNYVQVFLKGLVTELEIGIPTFIVVWLLVEYYLRRLRKNYFVHIESDEQTDMKKLGRYTNLVAVGFAAVVAFVTAQRLWFQALQFTNSTGFGKKDPLFHLDISFYIFFRITSVPSAWVFIYINFCSN